ncbi:hypothetical protein [Dictyobacter formicarum]|uniref:hypothetical protein n=1 Tax=Dictyobacter formicarum TaxID=2778368 RepID=UPI001915CA27|nr:hypothetical protein [Dictyobacter formicarum]
MLREKAAKEVRERAEKVIPEGDMRASKRQYMPWKRVQCSSGVDVSSFSAHGVNTSF